MGAVAEQLNRVYHGWRGRWVALGKGSDGNTGVARAFHNPACPVAALPLCRAVICAALSCSPPACPLSFTTFSATSSFPKRSHGRFRKRIGFTRRNPLGRLCSLPRSPPS